MIFEHFALNVLNPVEIAKWYIENCGMKALKALDIEPFTHYLADESGRLVLEIYHNVSAKFPDYNSMHMLEFHFAFNVDDVSAYKDKLISAGARVIEESVPGDGSHIITFRDPFGLCLQLCKRAENFFNKQI